MKFIFRITFFLVAGFTTVTTFGSSKDDIEKENNLNSADLKLQFRSLASALSGGVGDLVFQDSSGQTMNLWYLGGTRGFWRFGVDENGTIWFISPEEKPMFINAVTSVQPYQLNADSSGRSYISSDWNGGLSDHGNLDVWASTTINRVLKIGFKAIGAWSHPILLKYNAPMTVVLNLLREAPLREIDSPRWADIIRRNAVEELSPLVDLPNLIGYYPDNEVVWDDDAIGPGKFFDDRLPTQPQRTEVLRVMKRTWPAISNFNSDWKTHYPSWTEARADILTWKTLPYENFSAYNKLRTAWLRDMADRYFRTTTSILRDIDPNHLNLGVRFPGWAVPEVVQASRGFTDAQSVNVYVSDAKLDQSNMQMMHELSGGQPVLIGEYSFHSLDNRSGDQNRADLPGQVADQEARAQAYQDFTRNLAEVPYVVGADWFQWNDEPPGGRANGKGGADREDANVGIVDIYDKPYEQLTSAILDTTYKLWDDHMQSAHTLTGDLWRQAIGNIPTVFLPQISSAPYGCQMGVEPLSPIQYSGTVGAATYAKEPPKFFLAENGDFLFVSTSIPKAEIMPDYASSWWRQDYFGIQISTRPRNWSSTSGNEYFHHFFFNPSGGGIVGQWHRNGDDLTGPTIPQKQISVRFCPNQNSYSVKLSIPKKLLRNYDPVIGLSVLLSARDAKHGFDYFWLANTKSRSWAVTPAD